MTPYLDPSGWLLLVVVVSWAILLVWITALYVWAWKEDRRVPDWAVSAFYERNIPPSLDDEGGGHD